MILGVVIINALISYIQEANAERAVDSLKQMLAPAAMALRDGKKTSVPARELVPGDIVFLHSGDRVPADMRLLHAKNLRIDEATLTGESVPVDKTTQELQSDASIADRRNLAFAGTMATTGAGSGVVVATGDQTQLGRIAGMLNSVEGVDTPLIRRLAQFSKTITIVIVAFCVLVFVVGVMTGQEPIDMLMAAVALAVSAIPEGLPAIMTIALSIGVKRMAARNAVVRKLPAVESLGSATVICSDKTGTLTRNEMTVTQLIAADGTRYTVSGTGYDPAGEIVPITNAKRSPTTQQSVDLELSELLRCGAVCNDASLRHDGKQWTMEGDPTEGALLVLAVKSGIDLERLLREMPRRDEIPFESELQYMATLHHDHHRHAVIYAKGSPERLLNLCGTNGPALDNPPLDRTKRWMEQAAEMAAQGLRVLAVARKPVDDDQLQLNHDDLYQLQLLGLVGIMDPPRQEAIEAVRRCYDAGIQVKMITGDHAATAKSIAQQIGLRNSDRVITGGEVDKLDDAAVDQLVSEVNVFARVSPAHKLQFVRALQRQGHVVAMTGDGVNDAPALKQADIGVAMGITGTDVSKEASEMVLVDDNFASIERAVEEGRTVFNNLKKTIAFILPTNGGECLTLVAALLLGMVLPILPLHILWINLVTTVALAIALAFDPTDPDAMSRPPRDPSAPLIDRFLVWRIVYVSVLMAAATFGLFYYELELGSSLEAARATAVNAIVFFEVAYLFNSRHLTNSVINRRGLFGNRIVWYGVVSVVAMQLLFTYWPTANRLFEVAPITAWMWLRIVGTAVLLFLIVEGEKLLNRRIASRGER